MIKYNPELFYCEYVRVKRITSNYLYITTRADGRIYKSDNSIKDIYRKREVAKLKIHENVSRQYFKSHSMKEFKDLGQFACVAFYDGVVIAVEVQSIISSVKENQTWIATIDRIMSDLSTVIPSDKEVFINGKEIFWLDGDSALQNHTGKVSKDGSFYIQKVQYLSLSKVGVTIVKDNKVDDNDSSNNFSIDVIDTIGFGNNITDYEVEHLNFNKSYVSVAKSVAAVAFLEKSSVLAYNPNPEIYPDFKCFSPILTFDDDKISNSKEKEQFYLDRIFSIDPEINTVNPTYLNLNFSFYAGRLVGAKYGYEETEILKIHEIIKETGIISFEKIIDSSRKNYPIKLPPLDGLAWLFRFIYKEKDLNNQRDLSNLFYKILKVGFVSKNKIEVKFKKGMSENDIKMLSYG